MPLVTMKDLLRHAKDGGYAVGAFSVGNMEMVMGAVRAAEELRSPAILQIAQVRLDYSPLSLIGPLMVRAAEQAGVPVAVHFDHGATLEGIREALEAGFTSVMFDGSRLPLGENIETTRRVIELAKTYGAAVEGEIGQVGGTEDGGAAAAICSDPAEAVRFYRETGVDALAIAIGNAHGNYKGKPQLRLDVLEEIAAALPEAPLVLHGGTGISDEDFRYCIQKGIRKINIATASFDQAALQVRECLRADSEAGYFSISRRTAQGAKQSVARHIGIFGSAGHAVMKGVSHFEVPDL